MPTSSKGIFMYGATTRTIGRMWAISKVHKVNKEPRVRPVPTARMEQRDRREPKDRQERKAPQGMMELMVPPALKARKVLLV